MVHAAGESARLAERLPPGTHAVVLGATGAQLLALERQLGAAGVPHAAIREPDPPYCGALLAIGVRPAPRASLRRHLAKLRLLAERPGERRRPAKDSATDANHGAHVEPPAAAVRREDDEDRREEGPD